MAEKYRGSASAGGREQRDGCRRSRGRRFDGTAPPWTRYALHEGVAAAFGIVDAANEYIAETAPWALAKDPANADRLSGVLFDVGRGHSRGGRAAAAGRCRRRRGDPAPRRRANASHRISAWIATRNGEPTGARQIVKGAAAVAAQRRQVQGVTSGRETSERRQSTGAASSRAGSDAGAPAPATGRHRRPAGRRRTHFASTTS